MINYRQKRDGREQGEGGAAGGGVKGGEEVVYYFVVGNANGRN